MGDERKKSMEHAMTLYQQDIVLKKEPRSFQRLRRLVNLRGRTGERVDFSKEAIN